MGVINRRPADNARPGSLHWLHRSTGAPYWMVATWTGDAWYLLTGKIVAPDSLTWWVYVCPATPPRKPKPSPCRAADMKVSQALVFENGSLHVRQQGYGDADGGGYFAFDEGNITWEPHEEDSRSSLVVPISRDDLLFLRNHLNSLFPEPPEHP